MHQMCHKQGGRMDEQLGNQAINQKVTGSKVQIDVSLGKALQPSYLVWDCPCTYCKSLCIRSSAKWLNVNVMNNSKAAQ